MKSLINIMLLGSLVFMQACEKGPVEDFDVKVGDNDVTTELFLTEKYGLNLTGSFPIDIKGNNYGEIFLNGATDANPFSAGLTISLEAFTGDVWDGFGSTSTLPNGDPLPPWITPYELVGVDIPTMNDHFGIILYGGYHNPYYVGLAVTLKILDNHYPEGLQVSQSFKKEGENWGTVTLFGPTRDGDGNVIQHGGIFFVVGISTFLPGEEIPFEPGTLHIRGKNAHLYKSKKAQKKLMKQIQKAVREFNKLQ